MWLEGKFICRESETSITHGAWGLPVERVAAESSFHNQA
jgi:hypothetical protein